jgi:hypothetical protein
MVVKEVIVWKGKKASAYTERANDRNTERK